MEEKTQVEQAVEAARAHDAAHAKDLPLTWEIGQHHFVRVPAHFEPYPAVYEESPLSVALDSIKRDGLKVLDFERFSYSWGAISRDDWIIKTMAPRDAQPT